MIVSKTSNSINLANSNSITIDGQLRFESDADGRIFARDNGLVYVSSSDVERTGEGFVDGSLAYNLGTGDLANSVFTVGNGEDYTPVEIDLEGAGGTTGYLMVTSNDRTVNMIGSQLEETQNVEREYDVELAPGSSFDIGNSRSFNMVIHYINPDDLRNGANSNTFETARFDDPLWAPRLMQTGVRTLSSVQSLNNTEIGTFVVGPEDFFLEMYTRETGDFNDPSNWSLYGYGGPQSSFAPRPRDIPYIGDGDEITLSNDINILNRRTLTVEQAGPSGESGTFIMAENVLSGSGTFSMNSGAWLSFGDESGLMATANQGNIQTAQRNYNPGNHNNGSFEFTGTNSSTLGDGFPSNLTNLYINAQDEVFAGQSLSISEDLRINSGILDLEENIITGTVAGDFSIEEDARIRIAGTNDASISLIGFNSYFVDPNSYFVFDGTNQTITNFPANFNQVLGYGNVVTRNPGTKLVDASVLVRGNLFIQSSALLQVEPGVDALRINGNFLNQNSLYVNYGKTLLGTN